MKTLRVSLIQGETRWHDPAGNRLEAVCHARATEG